MHNARAQTTRNEHKGMPSWPLVDHPAFESSAFIDKGTIKKGTHITSTHLTHSNPVSGSGEQSARTLCVLECTRSFRLCFGSAWIQRTHAQTHAPPNQQTYTHAHHARKVPWNMPASHACVHCKRFFLETFPASFLGGRQSAPNSNSPNALWGTRIEMIFQQEFF